MGREEGREDGGGGGESGRGGEKKEISGGDEGEEGVCMRSVCVYDRNEYV